MRTWKTGLLAVSCVVVLASVPACSSARRATGTAMATPSVGPGWLRVTDVPDARVDATLPVLATTVPEVLLEGQPLEQVVDFLRDITKLNITVRWQVLADAGVDRDKEVTIHVRNLRLSQVLCTVLHEVAGENVELGFESAGDNGLVISTAADLEKEKLARIYDVRPLLRLARCDGHRAPSHLSSGDRLVVMIRSLVRPETWRANGGDGDLECLGGVMVVRASRSVHRQTEAFLNTLRSAILADSAAPSGSPK